ncbi:MAG: SurA N-terminal domain-containing protein [Deltaproteobacteria bacterium]|nr:SurA N-terminal domain-containing protein [Deltaproteobacteria bacterium]
MAFSARKSKSFFWLSLLIVFGLVLGAGTFWFKRYYHRQLWDPDTAALVNGRPISRAALEELLVAGLNARTKDNPAARALAIGQILDRLVVEELIRQKAEDAGFNIPEAEVKAYVAALRALVTCQGDKQPALCQVGPDPKYANFFQAIRLRRQLEKLAQKVIPVNWRPSSQKWRVFWGDFLTKMPKGPVYQAQVLFVQAHDEAYKILKESWRRNLTLAELETKVRFGGYATLFSRAMSIDPLDPKTLATFGRVNLRDELAISLDPPYLTQIFRLPNSYAVLEVLAIRPAIQPTELARAGQKAFEESTGQATFLAWVAKLKSEATIVINPNYPDLGQSTGTSAKPKSSSQEVKGEKVAAKSQGTI